MIKKYSHNLVRKLALPSPEREEPVHEVAIAKFAKCI